jgi:CubicO group peptidase (beta-lactamase class C family)
MVGQGAYVRGPRKSYSGGAGLLSTAQDYARFLQMTLNGGELDGVRIRSRKSIELMTVNHVGDLLDAVAPGTGFGLGFQVVDDIGGRGTLGSVGEYGWGWRVPLDLLGRSGRGGRGRVLCAVDPR